MTVSADDSENSPSPATGTFAALWRNITKVERGKVNSPAIALRNSLAVSIPLAIGVAFGNPAAGAAFATGALNVSYSDGTDPYAHRARRMLAWSILGAIAVFSGSVSGEHHTVAILLTGAWAFLAGLLLSISQRAGDLGLNTLVSLIVFAARGPTTLAGAFDAALLVLGGGLLQTTFALLFWPVHRYDPERRTIAGVYSELASTINGAEEKLAEPLASTPGTQLQDTIAALGRDRSIERERFRLLYDQADRIRFSAFLLRRLQSQLAYQSMAASREAAGANETLIAGVDRIFENASLLLRQVSLDLVSTKASRNLDLLVKKTGDLASGSRKTSAAEDSLSAEICSAIDTFTGQMRAAAELADHSTAEGEKQFQRREEAHPVHLQVLSWLDTLRANLTFRSASFRHSIRMTVFIALGDLLSRSTTVQRPYWIPMTIAVILRPDFTTTFSRGALRLGGTLAGLLLATGLYHALPVTALPELVLVTVFTFALRMFGPANYGVFSVAITGLIVFLIAAGVGTPPGEVVVQRGINTVLGGCVALAAYSVWPTWEKRRVPEVIAEMLDATRLYFQAVMAEFDEGPNEDAQLITERARQNWRRARSDAETSVERVSSEPRISAQKLSCLQSALASSHLLIHAVMGLEAGIGQSGRSRYPKELRAFAHDVEFTLYFLEAALRGSPDASHPLPKLREDHRRMIEASGSTGEFSGDFVLVETDRMVVALNTLREQILKYVH